MKDAKLRGIWVSHIPLILSLNVQYPVNTKINDLRIRYLVLSGINIQYTIYFFSKYPVSRKPLVGPQGDLFSYAWPAIYKTKQMVLNLQ